MRRSVYPSWPAYLSRLVPLLAELVGVVRDEGSEEIRRVVTAARRLPAPEGVDPVEAVVVALAAMVDPERTPGELLGWIDATVPAPRLRAVRPSRSRYRPELVARAVEGGVPFGELRQRERGDAALGRWRRGVSAEELAAWTGLSAYEAMRLVERAEAREAAAQRVA